MIDGSIDGSKPNDHHNDRQKEARAINDILNKLLENPNAIIRKTSKTSKASHIHERCEKADGKTIKDALKIEYTYDDELCTYSKTDIKYDYKKSWIIIESPSSGGAVDIEFNSDEENDGSPAVGGGPSNENNIDPPSTPLSGAPTPIRPITRSASASRSNRQQQRAETSARIRRPAVFACEA